MTRDLWTVLVGLAFIACKKDDAPAPAPKASDVKANPAKVEPVADDSAAIAARPKVRVTLDDLGRSIEVPEGTGPTPQSADRKLRAAHVETGKGGCMVTIDAVDEYSTPSFEKASERGLQGRQARRVVREGPDADGLGHVQARDLVAAQRPAV